MKFYSKTTLSQHTKDLRDTYNRGVIDPVLEYYIVRKDKGRWSYPMVELAFSYNREWASSGILDGLDILQFCYTELMSAWSRVDWRRVNEAANPKGQLWAYLKLNIKTKVKNRIEDNKDGVRIPQYKRLEIQNTKNVDDFLTQLFPQMWFWQNDEKLNFIDEPPERWDTLQTRQAMFKAMDHCLTQKEKDIICMKFGIGEDKMSSKEVANHLNITVSNVDKTKFIALEKLDNQEVKDYLEDFYVIE